MVDEKAGERVKVIDRRSFTTEGDPKHASAASPPESAPAQPPATPPAIAPPTGGENQAGTERAGSSAALPSEVGFLELVDFLAQQALALLSGQIPGRGHDPVTARFFIDLLAVVQAKTAAQLAGEEASYLEDVLYQLRSLYLAATR